MIDPLFLSFAQIQILHEKSIHDFGGTMGLRDEGLVRSAIASAENTYYYGDGDLFDIAASYAFHISESQAFLDGNKRTALKAMVTFLERNGVSTEFDLSIMYDLMMALANRGIDKPGLAAALREMSTK